MATAGPPGRDARTWALCREADYSAAVGGEVPGAVRRSREAPDRRPTVLVVDDEPEMRCYLVDLLSSEYRVLEAPDGRAALETVRHDHPDLVVLDLMMPEVDGLQVCRHIKRGPPSHTKIVLLTARADQASKLDALENGADDFLTKPFSSIEVKTRLRNLYRGAELERVLREKNEALQDAMRALRETQARLIQSEKLRALGQLAAGLLHEINNPLNFAMTAMRLARQEPAVRDNPGLDETLADIDEGRERIRVIVKDLYTFAHPAKADTGLAFDVGQAVETALHFTAHEHKGIAVHRALPDACIARGAKAHIVQVLVNLIMNAVKAIRSAPSGRDGHITIACQRGAGHVTVSVRDTGCGIAPDALPRIFEPFYSTREVGEGLGMGLAICHTIVKSHGGELRVESRPGHGTEFWFDLPSG